MVCLQRYTKVFRCITAYNGKMFKAFLTYLDCTKYNKIDIGHSHIQKHVSDKKNDIKSTNIICTGSHKYFSMHCILREKMFRGYF